MLSVDFFLCVSSGIIAFFPQSDIITAFQVFLDSVMSKKVYPFLNAKKTKPRAFDQYYEEPKTLGKEGMNAILDEGKKLGSDLTNTLNSGGAAVFPHTFLSQCGYQIAAVVHAILDSGADQVLVLGVLHPMSESLMQARSKELNEEDISTEISKGIFGPGL